MKINSSSTCLQTAILSRLISIFFFLKKQSKNLSENSQIHINSAKRLKIKQYKTIQSNIKQYKAKIISKMFNQESTIFPKQIKIDDYESHQNNHLIILESSNLLLGTGSRTSTAAIVLAKALHSLVDEGELTLKDQSVLQIGSGVGLVGLYLAVLGANITLCDTPAMKDLVQKNININRKMLHGKVQFQVASWKKTQCLGTCKQGTLESQTISTSSSDKYKQTCLYHLAQNFDLTLVCQCGGMADLQSQLNFMGKQEMILCFMKRQNWTDGLDERIVEQYLNSNMYEYQKIKTYHPDYIDNRISIFRIYPLQKAVAQLQKNVSNLNIQNKMQQQMDEE